MNSYLYEILKYDNKIFKIIFIIAQIILLSIIINRLIPIFKNKVRIKLIINDIRKISKLKYHKEKIDSLFNELNYEYTINNYNIFSFFTYLLISTILFVIAYISSYTYFNLNLTSIIISIIISVLPYISLKILIKYRNKKILQIFPSYLVNLKTYTRIDNNIITAIKKTSVTKPLKDYIEIFNISNQNGISSFESFETLKKNINIEKINNFITLLQYCSINGGDVTKILDKYSKMQMRINLRDEKEKQNIYTSKLSLIILILINIYILFGFILSNSDNYTLITTTFFGQTILNINIISFAVIGYLYYKITEI